MAEESSTDVASSKRQIRPKLRSSKPDHPSRAPPLSDGDDSVEEIKKRMDNWMSLGDTGPLGGSNNGHSNSCSTSLASLQPDSKDVPKNMSAGEIKTNDKKGTKSILKIPKYTKKLQIQGHMKRTDDSTKGLEYTEKSVPNDGNTIASETDAATICKSIVVERDPTRPMRKRKVKPRQSDVGVSHTTVEGYTPSVVAAAVGSIESSKHPEVPSTPSAENSASEGLDTPFAQSSTDYDDATTAQIGSVFNEDTDKSGDEPLILNTLEELFIASGEVPITPSHDPNKITPDAQLLEADIAFAVMTQDQYDGNLSKLREQHEEERQEQLRIFTGTVDIFNEGSVDEEGGVSDEESDDLMEMFMEDEDADEENYFLDSEIADDEDDHERQPRVFRLLWETLAEWFTSEAARYLSHLSTVIADGNPAETSWKSYIIERSDIEASRCAGLMAVVKLYLPKVIEELGLPQELRRTADLRLGELLRSFSYVLEAPKLPVKLWKAMTCVFLEIVLVEQHKGDILVVPPSAQAVGLTKDEYRYLVRDAVKSLGVGTMYL